MSASGCLSSQSTPNAMLRRVAESDSMPILDSLAMRHAILGRWQKDAPPIDDSVLHWASYPVSQVLIEPFDDRKDPTVLKTERALASWGHKNARFRSPTSIMANIRVRFQRADSVDIDTLLVSGDFYPAERSIEGETMGARVKGQISFQLVGPDRLLVNSFPYLRIKNPASP